MRVAIVGFYHETNTFALEHNGELDAHVEYRQELIDLAHPKSYIGGFLEGMRGANVELVPIANIRFAHGGIIRADVYEYYRDMLVHGLRDAGRLDGVFYALHGAMAAEDPFTDAEGGLLQAARDVLPTVPFVATYDFHGIMSHEECALLASAFPNDTNPHIDSYERGLEAAASMKQILAGDSRPVTRVVHIPIIGPNIGQSTWSHIRDEEERLPLYQLNIVRKEMEQTPGVINLTIMGGYGYADTPNSCMSVMATTEGDADLADRMARNLAARVWAERERILKVRPIVTVDDGVRNAMRRAGGPVALVDLGDDPGSACAADSPAVLQSLLRHGAHDAVVTIRDPNVVRMGMAAGIGATLSLGVGGAIDQRFYHPLRVTGVVRLIDDGNYMICGPTHGGWSREVRREAWREAHAGPRVVLRLENKVDVIFSNEETGKDRDFFKSAGTILEEKKIIVVKSNQAHRASFDPIVAETIQLASPGASTVDYASLPFRHIPRPLWPIDRDFDWDPGSE